jgi:hypothetical protein
MITNIKVSQEDFEAAIGVTTYYDDDDQILTDEWTASARHGRLTIIHKSGYMIINPSGSLTDYYKDCVTDIARVFKSIYPKWKEY